MSVDPFPNELVEAAAVVCYSLAPEHDTSTYPHGYVPYDEARPSSRENARADALEVLTALYPLIEQRVIDRLAAQGGKNPYIDGDSIPTWAAWEAWDEGAACGVAAERARLAEAINAALDELGVPGPGYPAPVANAVRILRAALSAEDTE